MHTSLVFSNTGPIEFEAKLISEMTRIEKIGFIITDVKFTATESHLYGLILCKKEGMKHEKRSR